jgi:hypothetical protein
MQQGLNFGGVGERLKPAVLKTRLAPVLLFGINDLRKPWSLLFGQNHPVRARICNELCNG